MLAVIKTGGKQYLVKEKDTIKIEKLPGESGAAVVFNEVLLVADEAGLEVSVEKKDLAKKKVTGRIIAQGRAEKVVIVKQKPKKRYKLKKGHRQPYTEIEITKIA